MTFSSLVPSSFHNRDLAVLVRETERVKVVRTRHLTGPPFVHAHGDVELSIGDRPRPVRFMVGHAAPSPGIRLNEAELISVYHGLNLIYVADFNAIALRERPDISGVDPHHAARKCDTRAAKELHLSGFIDVGAHMNNPTPTVGHSRAERLKFRSDRVYTTLPYEAITTYGVICEADDLSDHRPGWAEFTIR